MSAVTMDMVLASCSVLFTGLLCLAKELGLDLAGVCFHVGSGASNPDALPCGIAAAATVFASAERLGFSMRSADGHKPQSAADLLLALCCADMVQSLLAVVYLCLYSIKALLIPSAHRSDHGEHCRVLDVGGGFPGGIVDAAGEVDLGSVPAAVNLALATHFPPNCGVDIIAEPCRCEGRAWLGCKWDNCKSWRLAAGCLAAALNGIMIGSEDSGKACSMQRDDGRSATAAWPSSGSNVKC